jgi:hypothetical protein
MLSGSPPFAGSNLAQIALRVAVQRQQPELPWQAHGSPALAQLLQGCFAYEPRERLSAGEALQLLSEAMRAAGVEPVERRGSPKAGSSSTSVLDAASTITTSMAGAGSSNADAASDVLVDAAAGAAPSGASSSTSGLAEALQSGLHLGGGSPQRSMGSDRSTPPLQQGQLRQPEIKPQQEPARQPKLQQQRLRLTQQQSGAIFISSHPQPRPPDYRGQAAAVAATAAPTAPVPKAPQPVPQETIAPAPMPTAPQPAPQQGMRIDEANSVSAPIQIAAINVGKDNFPGRRRIQAL